MLFLLCGKAELTNIAVPSYSTLLERVFDDLWVVGKGKKRGKTYIHGCEMVVSGVEVKADSPCPPPSSAIFPDQGTPVARIHLLKSQQTQKLLFYFKKNM